MPGTITNTEALIAADGPPRKRWTRAECTALDESGLWEGQHFELIEGELYNKMGKKRPHVTASTFLRGWLSRVFGGEFLDTEASIDVAPEDNPTNEPEPDITVLIRPSFEFSANPTPKDIRLAVEISDTTLRQDLVTKARLYARAGIAEYWVLDINAQRVVVHRNPRDGAYQSIAAYSGSDTVDSGAVAEQFGASDLFHSRI